MERLLHGEPFKLSPAVLAGRTDTSDKAVVVGRYAENCSGVTKVPRDDHIMVGKPGRNSAQ